jgi:hypothetical protein
LKKKKEKKKKLGAKWELGRGLKWGFWRVIDWLCFWSGDVRMWIVGDLEDW